MVVGRHHEPVGAEQDAAGHLARHAGEQVDGVRGTGGAAGPGGDASEVAGAEWFDGDLAVTDVEQAFLARMRRLATGWADLGVRAQDTAALRNGPLLLVDVHADVSADVGADVGAGAVAQACPPAGCDSVQVELWTTGPLCSPAAPLALTAAWGDQYLMENWSAADPDCLTVVGLPPGDGGLLGLAEELAGLAAQWVREQLAPRAASPVPPVAGRRWWQRTPHPEPGRG